MASLILPPKMPRTRANISPSMRSNSAAFSALTSSPRSRAWRTSRPRAIAFAASSSPPGGTMPMATEYTFSKMRGTDGSTVGCTWPSSGTICKALPPQ